MNPKRNQVVEVRIEGLGSNGRGLARAEGLTFSVADALPGDRVQARVGRVREGIVEARMTAMLEPGLRRIPAVCAHFGTCGGCLWQEVSYEDQVHLKAGMVRDALGRLGIEFPFEDATAAAEPFFYRNKMEFSFGQQGGEVVLGLHVRGKFDQVFDLQRCHLQSEASNRIVDAVRAFARSAGLRVYDLMSHRGLLRFVTVREGKGTGEMMVNLVTSEDPFPEREAMAQAVLKAAPEVVTFVHTINRRKAQVATGEETTVLHGEGFIRERLEEFTFRISPASFFQTNPRQAERLYDLVAEYADLLPGERALDLYCGTGAIAMFLARRTGSVLGVESSGEAVRDALRNCAENRVEGCRFVAGDAALILKQLRKQGERFDVAAVDPPRAGMHSSALQGLIELAPPRIVYVSCNPEALATDVSRLTAAGYRAERARLVDLFPQTAHCEVVVKLVKRG
ncbi:MAG: 23S rRNA (uracil(1939)-C(5))-methyltransferase RlmD [Candidatus Latescibacteria bacterium]|nr:23S rRNA (uracil(1939)-C(5))-methyltransferase RlmD [Candidatus Latescibacterota bacterium]